MNTKPCCRCGSAVVSLAGEESRFGLCLSCWRAMPTYEIIRRHDDHHDHAKCALRVATGDPS